MVSQESLYSTPTQTFQSVETALLELWDKAKRAADMISGLRESNTKLIEHIKTVEKSIVELQNQISAKEKEIEELKKTGSFTRSLDTSDGAFYLSPDEREALERKISELLERLNAHFS